MNVNVSPPSVVASEVIGSASVAVFEVTVKLPVSALPPISAVVIPVPLIV